MRFSLLLTVLLSISANAGPGALSAPGWERITAARLRADTRFLASDLLEGRGPSTRGDSIAEEFIATRFEALGLRPAAPGGGWFQPFDLVGVTGNPETLGFRSGNQQLSLQYAKDFIAVSGAQQPESRVDTAEVVFVGFGIVAPEYQWDDFKDVDVRGKVLLMLNNDPADDPQLFAGKARLWYGRWDYKYEMAAKKGAAGAILLHTPPSAGYPWQVVQTSWAGEQFDLPQSPGPHLQMRAWTTKEATRRLVALGGKELGALLQSAQSRSFHPIPLGVTVSTRFKNAVRTVKTANVLGELTGSDPTLAPETVVVTAHHDHLGRKRGASPGSDDIYNGAVDNASGVAALLSVAEAMASLPRAPRRSVLFAAVAAEEQGLLGSRFLVEHPPVPVGALAADINVDGLNIWGRTRDVTVVGLGKSSLDPMIEQIAKRQQRVIKPDERSDRGFFYRSDQFNFAKRGVPSAYFTSGLDFLGRPPGWGLAQHQQWEETNYHQPSDQVTVGWDLSGAVEDCQLYLQLALEVANAQTMPRWNPGDEFEAARVKALGDRKAGGAAPPSPPVR